MTVRPEFAQVFVLGMLAFVALFVALNWRRP